MCTHAGPEPGGAAVPIVMPKKKPDRWGQGSFNGPGQTRTGGDSCLESMISDEAGAENGAKRDVIIANIQHIAREASRLTASDCDAVIEELVKALLSLCD